MTLSFFANHRPRSVISICVLALTFPLLASAQESKIQLEKPPEPAAPESPFIVERLETRVRFETDGQSRREVHTVIKINAEPGARQFARLNFDYNRSFEQVEIPLLRVLHANGGTTEILPSAVSDQPNPAVVDAPAYHDVRRKSARILGLQPGDTLEYRVMTTVSHHPLAPDFWLTHSFARSGTVAQEIYELDLPSPRQVKVRISSATPATSTEKAGDGPDARIIYRWQHFPSAPSSDSLAGQPSAPREPDIELSTLGTWQELADRLAKLLQLRVETPQDIAAMAVELTKNAKTMDDKIKANYEFVSSKIRTVNLPLGASGFRTRAPVEILASGYASPEDKQVLFASLNNNFCGPARAALVVSASSAGSDEIVVPAIFDHILTETGYPSLHFWMDLGLEVAPYQMIPSQFRGKRALIVDPTVMDLWTTVPQSMPFPATQRVSVNGLLDAAGRLTARVKYALRGDNELLLRTALHRAPREQWKNLAQLLSLSDGFRGEVSNVVASDPSATREPFTLEYDIAQPSFVNWSKAPVRFTIPLPTLGLPEAPARTNPSGAPPIDLGTPLEVETQVALRLPPRTTARAPVPTAVRRDYAEFASIYAVRAGALTASRRLKFLLREIPAARAADYAAFVRAVQNDEAQEFTLERAATPRAPSRPPAPRKSN